MRRQLWTRLSAAALAALLTAALPAEAWAAAQEGAAAPAEEAPLVETAPAPAPQTAPSAPQETHPGTSNIAIDETNFPDANFREFVKTLDGGNDGSFTQEEIAKITEIDCQRREIRDLTGIEHFTALTKLICANNNLSKLDVRKNTALTWLNCYKNWDLRPLDVTKNVNLEYLNCSITGLSNLDLSQNQALTTLMCHSCFFTELDVSQNTALSYLECQNNQLTSLDVSNNTELGKLQCWRNQLIELDLSNNTKLGELQCQENQLAFLNLEKNTQVTKLQCHQNTRPVHCGTPLQQLKGFDVSKVSSIQGGSFDGGKVNYTGDTLTYRYDLGNGESESFSMTRAAHNVTLVNGKEPTCTTEGWNDYYQCSGCGKNFEKKDGTEEITDLDAWKAGEGKLDKTSHTPVGEWKHDNTHHWKECSVCKGHAEQAEHTYDS